MQCLGSLTIDVSALAQFTNIRYSLSRQPLVMSNDSPRREHVICKLAIKILIKQVTTRRYCRVIYNRFSIPQKRGTETGPEGYRHDASARRRCPYAGFGHGKRCGVVDESNLMGL